MIHGMIRVAAVLVVFGLSVGLSPAVYHSVFIAFLLSHYLLGFVYAWPLIRQQLSQRRGRIASGLGVAAGLLTGLTGFPAVMLFFGPHFALTEVYVPRSPSRSAGANFGAANAARFCLHLAAYLIILRHQSATFIVSHGALQQAYVVVLIASTAFLAGQRRWSKNAAMVAGATGLRTQDLVAWGGVVASIWWSIGWLDVLFYHITVWAFFPVVTLAGHRQKGILYGALVVGTVVLFATLTPESGTPWSLSLPQIDAVAMFLGYMHIATTYVSSRANPEFIRRAVGLGSERQAMPARS